MGSNFRRIAAVIVGSGIFATITAAVAAAANSV